MSIGKLIYICGIDGSGKTTLAKNLSNHFGDKSIFLPLNNSKRFINEIDSFCKEYNTDRWSIFSEYFRGNIWALELVYFCENILKPALKKYEYVFIDRYYICNAIYSTLLVTNKLVNRLHELLIKPDMVFYININPEIAFERILKRNEQKTPKESLDNLKLASDLYSRYLEDKSYYELDGEKSENQILKSVLQII